MYSRDVLPAILTTCLLNDGRALVAPAEPFAPKRDHVRNLHGESFNDTYFWLREKTSKDVLSHLNAENAYAKSFLDPLNADRDKLFNEFRSRMKETDSSTPYVKNGYWYYSRTVLGKQYPIQCRKKSNLQAIEEVVLDMNELAKGKAYLGVGAFEISPNSKLLAYSVDETGYRQYKLKIRNLETGKELPDQFGIVNDVVWATDNKTLFYTTENTAKRPDKLYRRAIGSKSATLLFEEKAPQFNLYTFVSSDDKYMFVSSESAEQSEVRTLDLHTPTAPLKLMVPRQGDLLYYPDHHEGSFYIRTNHNAKEFQIVRTPVANPGIQNWKTVVPQEASGTLSDMMMCKDFFAVRYTKQSVPQIRVIWHKTGEKYEIKFSETNYSAWFGPNEDFNASKIRLSYNSMITPGSDLDFDTKSKKLSVVRQTPVPTYDKSKYAQEFVWATARDGVKVPITLCYRKGMKSNRPLWLYAYGSYGSSSSPFFDFRRVSMLDRGVTYAVAHIRGGGELGEAWHDDGKMANKLNTFTDFIDCADFLVEQGYSSHDKMLISGGSAGGLLMGSVLNLRPNIAKVALVYVPFVDVINTMLDETLPLTTQEFLEWGNPTIKEQYDWIKAYSPYENIGPHHYPAMLVRTSLNDSQVPYWEAAKWVARLRDYRQNKSPLLLLCNMQAGHGGSSGRYDNLRNLATDYAFALNQLGVKVH